MQESFIGLPHLTHEITPISATLNNGLVCVECMMLTCVGREHAALGQTALAKEIPLRMDCDDRFLPLLGNNVDLDLAFLNVKHRIRQIPLQEDPPILSICRYGPTPIHGGKKRCNIEGRLALCVHEKFPSMKPALCVLKTRCSSGRAP